MNNNVQRLGETLASRMTKTAGATNQTAIELGTINGNMSLTPDSLQAVQIPKGDYMVNITLACETYETSSVAPPPAAAHTHRIPANFRGLQAGDRVLIAWCGNDAVVIAIVKSS